MYKVSLQEGISGVYVYFQQERRDVCKTVRQTVLGPPRPCSRVSRHWSQDSVRPVERGGDREASVCHKCVSTPGGSGSPGHNLRVQCKRTIYHVTTEALEEPRSVSQNGKQIISMTLGREVGAGWTGGNTGAGPGNTPRDEDTAGNCRPTQNVSMGMSHRTRAA